MELSHWNKKEQAPLVEFLGASLLSHPLMRYYCPDRDKREKFITRWLIAALLAGMAASAYAGFLIGASIV